MLKSLGVAPSVVEEIGRRRRIALLNSLDVQLTGIQRILGSATREFLKRFRIQNDFTDVDGMRAFLIEHQELLSQLPWGEFEFHPRMLPGLHAFLVELPLTGVLADDDLERLINTFVSEYYHEFYASDYTWNRPVFKSVLKFCVESYLFDRLMMSCRAVIGLSVDAEAKPIREHMRALLDASIYELGHSETGAPVEGPAKKKAAKKRAAKKKAAKKKAAKKKAAKKKAAKKKAAKKKAAKKKAAKKKAAKKKAAK